MRCRFCGSTAIHPDSQRKNFSTGKAIAGAVTFGYVGAAAGLIGKDQKGYRCASCGSFMESPMDAITESSVNNAVIEAETGRSSNMLNYYRRQYPNIQANIPIQASIPSAPPAIAVLPAPTQTENNYGATIKRIYAYDCWEPDAPVYVDAIILRSSKNGDELSLRAWNQSKSALRSLYFKATVYDDTQDKVSESECVYQALNIEPGIALPESVSFSLHSSVAYSVVLLFEKAAFTDGSVWRANPEQTTYSIRRLPQNELTEDAFPRLKYVREQLSGVSKIDKKAPLFLPTESDEHWQCICGHPSLAGEKCRFCGASLTQVENALDQEKLQSMQKNAVMERAASRAKEFTSRINSMNEEIYAGAAELETTGDPEKLLQAAGIFESLPFFKDAKDRAIRCREQAAETEKHQKEETARKEAAAKAKKEANAKTTKKTIAIITPIIVACIAFANVLTTVIIPGNKYSSAMALYNSQQYEEAYKAFVSLNYKDSSDKAAECFFLKQKAGLKKVTVGTTIQFGLYEQDNNTSNGKEEIAWKVLAVEGSKALIISQYALDCQRYNTLRKNVTWETCTLRKWLNETFYNTAFGPYHQQMVSSSIVTADKNPEYSTSPGNSTTDQVFLLSITEVNKYFTSDSARICKGTAYCFAQGAGSINGNCFWWLRSPGDHSSSAASVRSAGGILGENVDTPFDAVRPALWIDLGS